MSDDEAAVREYLGAINPEAMMLDGLEGAIVGAMARFGQAPVALYSKRKCLDIFVAQGCSEEEAEEHFDFNVIGAWVGDGTPAFMMDCDELAGRTVHDSTLIMLNTLEACEEKLKLRGEE
tara:strand:+ start:54 stop:413 length:360 start_codon:yes stop_codon:yes gene_type:complete